MRISGKYHYDPFAAPVGKSKDVTAKFTGKINEMSDEQIDALKEGQFVEVELIFSYEGSEYPLKFRDGKKHISDVTGEHSIEDYNFTVNFITSMAQVAKLAAKEQKDLETVVKNLTGKEFTIRITKTEKDAPNYKIIDPAAEKTAANGKSTYTAY